MAGEVLNEVPESPSITKSPSTDGMRSMMGRPSGLIMIMPAQPPRMVESAKRGRRWLSRSRQSAT